MQTGRRAEITDPSEFETVSHQPQPKLIVEAIVKLGVEPTYRLVRRTADKTGRLRQITEPAQEFGIMRYRRVDAGDPVVAIDEPSVAVDHIGAATVEFPCNTSQRTR